MKTLLLTFLVLLVIPFAACKAEQQAGPTEELIIESRETGEKHIFNIEIAETPEQLQKGLMFRKSMAEDHGMLFVFNDERERGFWMKNTLIPLDMIFVRQSGIIHHIHENAKPHDLTGIRSNGPAASVLELNGGTAARLGIKPGDTVYRPQTGQGKNLAQ